MMPVDVDPNPIYIGKYAFMKHKDWLLASWHGPQSSARIARKGWADHRAATCKICDAPMDLVVRRPVRYIYNGTPYAYSSYRHRTIEQQSACLMLLEITKGAKV